MKFHVTARVVTYYEIIVDDANSDTEAIEKAEKMVELREVHPDMGMGPEFICSEVEAITESKEDGEEE